MYSEKQRQQFTEIYKGLNEMGLTTSARILMDHYSVRNRDKVVSMLNQQYKRTSGVQVGKKIKNFLDSIN